MKNISKIRDIDNIPQEKIEDGANYWNYHTQKCRINGEKYPMFVAKIINKLRADEMPFIIFIGKPGEGKTYAAATLGHILTEQIGFLKDGFKPETNIHYDNLPFLKSVSGSRQEVLHKPEINTTLHALDYNDEGNRQFEKMLNLSRIFGNLITGDAQKLYRCDRAIRENHTFRIVAAGGEDDYWFDVYYIDRKGDSETKNVDKKFIQRWKPDLPPEKFQKFIDEKDENWKEQALEDGIEKLEKKKEKKEQDSGFTLA